MSVYGLRKNPPPLGGGSVKSASSAIQNNTPAGSKKLAYVLRLVVGGL
jgi:hypothetical protein